MSIRALGNPGDDFVSKFKRALGGDSTGKDAASEFEAVFSATGGTKTTSGVYTIHTFTCLLYTSPSPRDYAASRMPSSA